MPKYIAFLRAINVGSHIVKMDKLRAYFETMGFDAVETFIASGNVIFESSSKSSPALERRIEKALEKELEYEVATFVRRVTEVGAVANYRPFSEAAMKSAGALNVAFLAAPLKTSEREKLATLETAIDEFHVHGCEVYWLCKIKQSDSKFSNVVFERTLGVRTTFRGISTIRKLEAKYGST